MILSFCSLLLCCCLRAAFAMPLSLAEIQDIQAECMAEDIDITDQMTGWTREQVTAFFESGGTQLPGSAAATPQLSGLHTMSSKLIDGSTFEMSSLLGKPAIMVNVASR